MRKVLELQCFILHELHHKKSYCIVSLVLRKPVFGIPTWSDTNRAVQSQKMARGLKFRIKIEEELHYSCGENKGAYQLRGYPEADLRLCFRTWKKPVFSEQFSQNEALV